MAKDKEPKLKRPSEEEFDLEIKTPEELDEAKEIAGVTTHKEVLNKFLEEEKFIERQKRDEQFDRIDGMCERKKFEGKSSISYLVTDLKNTLGHLDNYLEQAKIYADEETPEEWKSLIEQNPQLGVLNYGERWYDCVFGRAREHEQKREYARFSDDNRDNPIFGNASRLTWILSCLDPESHGFRTHTELEKSGLINAQTRKMVSDLIEEHIKITDRVNFELPKKLEYPERPEQFYQVALKEHGQETVAFANKAKEVMRTIANDIETNLKKKLL